MSRDSAYWLDIFRAAKLASSYLEGKTKEDFFKDTQCQDAVIRRFGDYWRSSWAGICSDDYGTSKPTMEENGWYA